MKPEGRPYASLKIAIRPVKQDKGRFAMRPGKRISKNGNVYYEYRGNRADANVNMHNASKEKSTGPKKGPSKKDHGRPRTYGRKKYHC
jgi:hypothetical protein